MEDLHHVGDVLEIAIDDFLPIDDLSDIFIEFFKGVDEIEDLVDGLLWVFEFVYFGEIFFQIGAKDG